ncbi:hypothetical protein CHUAL_012444 [Chamberlinius hualienensis]
MPRSFMITNRRYRSTIDYDSRECSPEASETYCSQFKCSSPPSSGSNYDFYNCFHRLSGLEQLAEISLATAHQWNPSPPSSPETASSDVSNYSDSSQSSTNVNNGTGHGKRRLTIEEPLALVSKIKDGGELDKDEDNKRDNWVSCDNEKLDEATETKMASNMCPECGKRYSTSSNLARHRQTHRSMEDKKARKCPHCDKVYVSMPAYSMHVRTHNQGCQCPFCGKCYSRPWLLQGHIRTHTGEKPFKCHVCNKAFADKSNLRAHVQTHSDTKPFVCQRCGKAFALKSYLYKHEESSCMRAHATTSGHSIHSRSMGAESKRYS